MAGPVCSARAAPKPGLRCAQRVSPERTRRVPAGEVRDGWDVRDRGVLRWRGFVPGRCSVAPPKDATLLPTLARGPQPGSAPTDDVPARVARGLTTQDAARRASAV